MRGVDVRRTKSNKDGKGNDDKIVPDHKETVLSHPRADIHSRGIASKGRLGVAPIALA